MYKIGTGHQNFWCGILVCLVVVCPFLASAEQPETQSEPQEAQVQPPPQVTQKDIRDIIASLIRNQRTLNTYTSTLIEAQETLNAHTTRYMVILGILLLAILLVFTWLFLRYRNLDSQVNDISKWIVEFSNVNSSLRQDLPDIRNRIQKLEIESQNSTREILNLLKPIADKTNDGVSSPPQVKLEVSKQPAEDTSDLELTPAIADLCDRYNAGIQDKNQRNEFLQRFHKYYKIHVENATDRRVKQQIDPVFKTHHAAGNFLGCHVEAEKIYAVVPAYQLRIVHAILHYDAFVDVFECHGLESDDPDSCYEVVRIIKPAIFEPDDAKEAWKLESKGILELKEV